MQHFPSQKPTFCSIEYFHRKPCSSPF